MAKAHGDSVRLRYCFSVRRLVAFPSAIRRHLRRPTGPDAGCY